jgi:hypothetical protein
MVGFDKALHFLFSFGLAMYDPFLAFVAGVGKECGDALSGGVADVYDLVADWAGIASELLARCLLS